MDGAQADDVAFLSALIDHFLKDFNVDPETGLRGRLL